MRIALVVMAGLVAMLALVDPAGASTGGRQIAVSSTFTDPGFATGFRTVRCGVAQPGFCEAEFQGHSTTQGTITGFEDYTVWGRFDPDAKSTTAYAHEKFTGVVTGCGTGTFEFFTYDVKQTPNADNPALQDLSAKWYLIAGSGTGDLARLVSGSGTETGVVYPDTSNSGTFAGQLICR